VAHHTLGIGHRQAAHLDEDGADRTVGTDDGGTLSRRSETMYGWTGGFWFMVLLRNMQ